MSKSCKATLFLLIVFLLLHPTLSNAGESKTDVNMGKVFTNGLLGALYGASLIGGGNTIIILMGDNTDSNIYRIKYGFAIGTILGLIYGTVTGAMGVPLIPGGTSDSPAVSKEQSSLKNSVLIALSSLQIAAEGKDLFIATRILSLHF